MRRLRSLAELRALLVDVPSPRVAALIALGAGSTWAYAYERGDLREVFLSQYRMNDDDALAPGEFDWPQQRDLLAAFLVELGPTLDPELRAFAEEVLHRVERAAEAPAP